MIHLSQSKEHRNKDITEYSLKITFMDFANPIMLTYPHSQANSFRKPYKHNPIHKCALNPWV